MSRKSHVELQGKRPGSPAVQRDEDQWWRHPARSSPTVQVGQAIRSLARLPSERTDQAVERARAMSWWPRVVSVRPVVGARYWTWVINVGREDGE